MVRHSEVDPGLPDSPGGDEGGGTVGDIDCYNACCWSK